MESSDVNNCSNGEVNGKPSVVERKSDSNLTLPKISDWASFSGHFQLAMLEAIAAKKKCEPEGLTSCVKDPAADVHTRKPVTKSVKWDLPNQPIGNFGKKLVNVNRATFATNIHVTSSLPRTKLVFPLIQTESPDTGIAIGKPDPTMLFVDSGQVCKDLRPRSAHELSHERANRLRREELDKYHGKYCNRLDVTFRRNPSSKFSTNVSRANHSRKLPIITCQDSFLAENSKDASQLIDTKCTNWLRAYCKYFK